MIDLDEIRKRHVRVFYARTGNRSIHDPEICDECEDSWPCDAIRLADEVEQWRAMPT